MHYAVFYGDYIDTPDVINAICKRTVIVYHILLLHELWSTIIVLKCYCAGLIKPPKGKKCCVMMHLGMIVPVFGVPHNPLHGDANN